MKQGAALWIILNNKLSLNFITVAFLFLFILTLACNTVILYCKLNAKGYKKLLFAIILFYKLYFKLCLLNS